MTDDQKIRYKLERMGYSGGMAKNIANGNFGDEFKSPGCRSRREADAIKAGYHNKNDIEIKVGINITKDPSDGKQYILPNGWKFKFENGRYSLVDDRGWPQSKHDYILKV